MNGDAAYIKEVVDAIKAEGTLPKRCRVTTRDVHDGSEGLVHQIAVIQANGKRVLVRVNVVHTNRMACHKEYCCSATEIHEGDVEMLVGGSMSPDEIIALQRQRREIVRLGSYKLPEFTSMVARHYTNGKQQS